MLILSKSFLYIWRNYGHRESCKVPISCWIQNATNICIKDFKKALLKASVFQRETREIHVQITQFSSIAESCGTATWWNANYMGWVNHAKPKQQQKKKQKQVKALTVRQARQSFHRGSICEDGLVEYGGHV